MFSEIWRVLALLTINSQPAPNYRGTSWARRSLTRFILSHFIWQSWYGWTDMGWEKILCTNCGYHCPSET